MELPKVRSEVEETFRLRNNYSSIESLKEQVKDLTAKIEFLQEQAALEENRSRRPSIESSILLAKAAFKFFMGVINACEDKQFAIDKKAADRKIAQEENRAKVAGIVERLAPLTFKKEQTILSTKIETTEPVAPVKKRMGRPPKKVPIAA